MSSCDEAAEWQNKERLRDNEYKEEQEEWSQDQQFQLAVSFVQSAKVAVGPSYIASGDAKPQLKVPALENFGSLDEAGMPCSIACRSVGCLGAASNRGGY